MKVNLVVIFFVFNLFCLNAQERYEAVNIGSVYAKLLDELQQCRENRDQNCEVLSNKIIEKGKVEKVPFLDYLYYKRAYYHYIRNEYDAMMKFCYLAIENPHPIPSQRSDIKSYVLLSTGYFIKGQLNKSISIDIKAAKILENGGNQLLLADIYNNIGVSLGEIGNNQKQIEYLKKAFELYKSNQENQLIATLASNIGLAYFHLKDTFNSNKWSKYALKLSESTDDLLAKHLSTYTLSLNEKDLIQSVEYAKLSVNYANKLQDKLHMANASWILAVALNNLDQAKEASIYAEQSVNFAKEAGDKLQLMRSAETAGKIHFKLGQKDKAADFYHTFTLYVDSITSSQSAKEVNEINTKYQTEKKEKQIIEQDLKIQKQQANLIYAIFGGSLLLSVFGGIFIYNRKSQKLKLMQLQQEKENAILNSFILGEERERNRISHELHDGVAAMIGAAKMSLESIPHLPKEKQMEQLAKVQGILEHSHADIRHIAHNLLPTVLEKEGLISATEHFISEINETKLICISVTDKNSNANENSKQLQLMLFRIIQELVNNIIKHSQAQNAEIIFTKFQNALQIEVIDDGLGYNETFTKDNQGLFSISQRLKSIGGNFKISNRNNGGTRAKLELNI
jgi:signal transduction histidine kinase